MTDPDDTIPCPAPDTEPCPPVLEEPEHEPFAIVRPVTFLPQVVVEDDLFDLASEDLDDDCT